MTDILTAYKSGDIKMLASNLDKPIDNQGNTILHVIASNLDDATFNKVSKIHKFTYDEMNKLNDMQETPLMVSVKKMQLSGSRSHDIIDDMIRNEADPSITDSNGTSIKVTETPKDMDSDIPKIQTLLNYYSRQLTILRGMDKNTAMGGAAKIGPQWRRTKVVHGDEDDSTEYDDYVAPDGNESDENEDANEDAEEEQVEFEDDVETRNSDLKRMMDDESPNSTETEGGKPMSEATSKLNADILMMKIRRDFSDRLLNIRLLLRIQNCVDLRMMKRNLKLCMLLFLTKLD